MKENIFVENKLMIKDFAEEEDEPNSDDFKKELCDRYEEYKNGGDSLTEEEMNSRIAEIIHS